MRKNCRWWTIGLWMAGTGFGCAGVPAASTMELEQKIVDGAPFPGLPAVGAITADGKAICTGTLIKPRMVVTAAHCVKDREAAAVKFVTGPNADRPEKILNVARLVPHPQYRTQAFAHDIAYLELTEDAGIQPLGVLKKIDKDYIGRELLFLAYGRDPGTAGEGALVVQKRAISFPITALNDLKFRFEKKGAILFRGEAGAPGLYKSGQGEYLLAGVTSCGSSPCTTFGVDTRIDAYRTFLGLSFFAQPLPEVGAGCGKENRAGRCAGRTLVTCESDCFETAVRRINCEAQGKECYSDRLMGWSRCQ